MRPAILLILCLCFSPVSFGQAVWKGRQYAHPVCSNPNCQMCYGPNGIQAQLNTQRQGYHVEKRQECFYVNGRKMCRIVTVRVPDRVAVPNQVVTLAPVPVPTLAPDLTRVTDLVPTPVEAIAPLLSILEPTKDDVLIEPGCGDARVLIAAAERYGCIAIGIELNSDTADAARALVASRKINVQILNGDAQDYSYKSATMISMYLYPDLMAKIVERLSPGTKIVSYLHEIPGVQNTKHSINGHTFYSGTK